MANKKIIRLIFILVLILCALTRLYDIGGYMNFLGDEGRDALVVKRLLVDGRFTLLGPITSVGLMHLGPAYYYFMLPFLWLFKLNPVGPAVMVALFAVATVYIIWAFMRSIWGWKAAAVAALLYSLSPLTIIHGRSSWNPNILPFWSLLIMLGLWRSIREKPKFWLAVAGLAFGIAIQLHYIALVMLPAAVIFLWLNRRAVPRSAFIWFVTAALAAFSPYILFEFRHDFINTRTVWEFISRSGTSATFAWVNPVYKFYDLVVRLFWRLVVIKNAEITLAYILFLISAGLAWRKKILANTPIASLLGLWFIIGIGSLAVYTGSTYDYYLMFLFPWPFIISGILVSGLIRGHSGKLFGVILLLLIVFWQVQASPLRIPANRQADQTRKIADFILKETKGEPYNFALIAGKNSDHAYRYFLEIDGQPPSVIENPAIDPGRSSVTGQLFVVCEEEICQPLGHPLWEIAGFGQARITGEWQVGPFRLFRLAHLDSQSV